MAKMRIYDIARSLQEKLPDLKSKDLVALLQKNGFEVKSTQSSIEDDAIGFLLKYYQNKPAQAAKKEKAVSTATKTKETAPKAAKEAPAAKEEKKEKAVKETPVAAGASFAAFGAVSFVFVAVLTAFSFFAA